MIGAEMLLSLDNRCGYGTREGHLPWSRVGWDFEHFRERTEGRVMVVGSTTYSASMSLAEEEDREIVVLTNSPPKGYINRMPSRRTVGSWPEAAQAVEKLGLPPIICGGATVCRSALNGEGSRHFRIDRVWLVEFDIDFDADIYFREKFEDFDTPSMRFMEDVWGTGHIREMVRRTTE